MINYEVSQKINIDVTKKLLQFIADQAEHDHLLDRIDSFQTGFTTDNVALNVWISFDYKDENDKSYIDKFLEAKSDELSLDEKKILIERGNSNVSLFEIVEKDGNNIKVLDLFQHKHHTLWEPELASNLNLNDLIFSRVADILGFKYFIGDINFLPNQTRDSFLKEALLDFNELRISDSSLTIKDYLKNNSLHLYTIYTNCILDIIKHEDDVNAVFFDELNEFQNYLEYKTDFAIAKKHLLNIIDFFEHHLVDSDFTLYDLKDLDLYRFFTSAIEQSFFLSMEDLNSYISTFKIYLEFKSNKDPLFNEAYKDILSISKDRFQIAKLFENAEVPFHIDSQLSDNLKDYLDDYSSLITFDFDKIMLYTLNEPIELTSKRKHIKRKYLIDLNQILDFSIELEKKAPNQDDFPLISIFYDFAQALDLVSIENNLMSVSPKGIIYLRLRDEEKYSIFFKYMWENSFVGKVTNLQDDKIIERHKNNLLIFLSSLKVNTYYSVADILPNDLSDNNFFCKYYPFLQYTKIIEYSLYPNFEIRITDLGKVIIDYLTFKNKMQNKSRVISLDGFKKTKQS